MIVLVRFEVRADKAEAFLQRVKRQADDSLRLEETCTRFDVAQDPADPARTLLYEIYDDEAAFAAHAQSAHYLSFDADTRDWVVSKTVERWNGPAA